MSETAQVYGEVVMSEMATPAFIAKHATADECDPKTPRCKASLLPNNTKK